MAPSNGVVAIIVRRRGRKRAIEDYSLLADSDVRGVIRQVVESVPRDADNQQILWDLDPYVFQ